MSAVASAQSRMAIVAEELAKLPAFLRRDFLTAWSYRLMFLSDFLGLLLQTVMFYFVGKMVNENVLPSYGGVRASYMEFAIVGVALSMFIALGLTRVARAVRSEQLMGTLESVLTTPTSSPTIQLGSVVYDLIYVPVRTGLFLAIAAVMFGLGFDVTGAGAALAILFTFIPFVWGLGIVTAAAMLTFRGSAAGVGFGVSVLTFVSGAYVPLTLFPSWIQSFAQWNPLAITMDGMREALLASPDWSSVSGDVAKLAPMALASLLVGIVSFRLALRRERRVGTLGQY